MKEKEDKMETFVTQKLIAFAFIFLEAVSGLTIDPKIEGINNTIHTYCLGSNQPIILKDPFSPLLAEDGDFTWILDKRKKDGSLAEEKTLLEYANKKFFPTPSRYSEYGFWGLQVEDVTNEDSGTYKAVLGLSSGRHEREVHIAVSSPPTLRSEKLAVTRSVNEVTGEVTLTCGAFASFGDPAVNIVWKASNGTYIPAQVVDGYTKLNLKADDAGTFSCEVDQNSPAIQCIPAIDRPKWEGQIVLASTADSGGKGIGVVIGIVVAILIVIIILIAIIFYLIKRRNPEKSYNTSRSRSPPTRDATKRDRENGRPEREEREERGGRDRGAERGADRDKGGRDKRDRGMRSRSHDRHGRY